jgi:hypothetical protein
LKFANNGFSWDKFDESISGTRRKLLEQDMKNAGFPFKLHYILW